MSISYKIICLGVNVCVYGLSSEGYSLASALVLNGVNVSMIDESQRMAFHLTPQIARNYQDVTTLIEEEPLLGLEPEEVAIQRSEYIFFAPRIRRIGQEARNEMIVMLKDAVSNIKKGTSIVFNIPVGFGMNLENIELIEHLTGFTSNDINYYYMPSSSFNTIIGYSNKHDDKLLRLLANVSVDSQFVDLESAEMMYTSKILSHYTPLISTFEIYKNAKPIDIEGISEMYIDDISSCLFDLRMISLSLPTQNPLSYIVNGSIKSIENYVKYVVDRLKKLIKNLELKISRIKVCLVWKLDFNELRGDKIHMLDLLENRLRDYIADVNKMYVNTFDEKTLMIITCSRNDYNNIKNLKGMNDIIILKANPFIR